MGQSTTLVQVMSQEHYGMGTSLITVKILIYGRTGKKANNGFTQSEYFTVAKVCFQGAVDRKLPDSNYKFV